MSLLVERFGDYSFIQALGASFKEVQKSPKAIRGTLKGVIGIIQTTGLVIVLGAPAYALSQGLKIADKTIKIYSATAELDLWVNYKYQGKLEFVANAASTFNKVIALPQLLCQFGVIPYVIPKFVLIGTDVLDIFLAIYDLSKDIPKAFEFRTDRPLKRTERKIEVWNGVLENIKKRDKASLGTLVKNKKLKIEKLDPVVLEAALITYAHDKKVKWENKKETLYIRQKSNHYSIALNISLATLSSFLVIGAFTSTLPVLIGLSASGLCVSYVGLYSFLYNTFNPEIAGVNFKHLPIKA